MRVLLYDHSGCLNHGCEALVRTTVNIIEKTVVKVSAKSLLTIKSSLKTEINATTNGKAKKQIQSQKEILLVFAFFKTCICSLIKSKSLTFLLKNNISINITDIAIIQT